MAQRTSAQQADLAASGEEKDLLDHIQADLSLAKPDIVEFRSGTPRIYGALWKPVGKGPFPAVIYNHGSNAQVNLVAGALFHGRLNANRRTRNRLWLSLQEVDNEDVIAAVN